MISKSKITPGQIFYALDRRVNKTFIIIICKGA